MQVLGIDVGGSGIKGAIVDVSSGQLCSEPVSLITPQPATPSAVIETVGELVRAFKWTGLVGCGFPAVIQNGSAKTAANIDASWIDVDVKMRLESETGCPSAVLNDADAAGLAEVAFGTGQGCDGTVLVLTLGTGIGSALFFQGQLFPNMELGFLPLNGSPAEHYTSAAVRTDQKLSWQDWAERLNEFLAHVERLVSPELIIIGGGVSLNHEKFFSYLNVQAQLLPAQFKNQAGIVGAACFAANQMGLRA